MATKKQTDKTDPVLQDPPTVEIAGETYTLRRLGLRDVFRVARILGNGVAVLGDTSGQYTPGQVLQVLVAALSRNEDEVLGLVADLLKVKRNELDDPDRFPMDSIVDVFTVLSEHQDLKAFLAKLEAMQTSLPEMQTASREASNS